MELFLPVADEEVIPRPTISHVEIADDEDRPVFGHTTETKGSLAAQDWIGTVFSIIAAAWGKISSDRGGCQRERTYWATLLDKSNGVRESEGPIPQTD